MEPSHTHSLQMVWINDRLVAENEVGPFDHGLLTGMGFLKRWWLTIRCHLHLLVIIRGCESASRFGLQVPSAEVLRRACVDVADANNFEAARIRVTVTGGTAPLGSEKVIS